MRGELAMISGLQELLEGPVGQLFVVLCARYLIFLYPVLGAATAFFGRRQSLRQATLEAGWSGIGAFGLVLLIGELVQRARPFRASALIHLLIPMPLTHYSFPSGHAAVAFAVAAALTYAEPSLGIIAFVTAVLIAFGRVAAGVHYPTDVIAGAVVGLVAFGIVRRLSVRLKFGQRDV